MTINEEFKNFIGEEQHTEACGKFIGTLLHAATVTHFMHLSTDSYAKHMALGAFYEGLPALVDSVAESYQSKYGIITSYPPTYTYDAEEPIDYLRALSTFVDTTRGELPQDTELQNDIDTIVTLINSTIYKIRFLS